MHISLASAFTEATGYQDVLLAKYNALADHQVIVVSDCHKFVLGKYVDTEEEDKVINYGIRLIRYKYDKVINSAISNKVRKVARLYGLLKKEHPDVILFHVLSGWELKSVAKYVKENPDVTLYADSHADYNNSAKNFVSKYILHRLFYRAIVQKSLPYISKVFYLSEESKDFLLAEYKVPNNKLEYYPLGGELVSEEDRTAWRKSIRKELEIDNDVLVVMHSGKLDKLKRTSELIDAFTKLDSERMILLIAGAIPSENQVLMEKINANKNIKWLGWKSSDELKQLLCASDIYAQPGSQSATMQNAICCGLPVMLYPHRSYKSLCKDNVIWVKNSEDMYLAMKEILNNPRLLNEMKKKSDILARHVLDYTVLANKLQSRKLPV